MKKIKSFFPWLLCCALAICLILVGSGRVALHAEIARLQSDLDYAMEHSVPTAYQRGLRDGSTSFDSDLEQDLMNSESEKLDLANALEEARYEAEENYSEGYRNGWGDAVFYSFDFLYEHGLGHLEDAYDIFMDDHC